MSQASVGLTVVVAFLLASSMAYAVPKRDGAPRPRPTRTMRVSATAYCDHGTTKSGVQTQPGIIAADPRVLPIGTVVRILDPGYPGLYKVMDTGSEIKGRDIDIFMPSCRRAKLFGRKAMRVKIITRVAPPR